MRQQDNKTERVAITLPSDVVSQCRAIADQSGLTLSKVLEHFARTGVRHGLTLTFSPVSSTVTPAAHLGHAATPSLSHPLHTREAGSKRTTAQAPSAEEARRAADEAFLAEVFEPTPPPRKPLEHMTDDELEDATDAAVPVGR